MKASSTLFASLLAVMLSACGGGGSPASAAVPVATTPAPAPAPAPVPADTTGMSHDAKQIAGSIRIGFNIGNTMEASASEPATGNEQNTDVPTLKAAVDVLKSYHQTFVDAVRSTGGRNAYRVLVVQGPETNIDLTVKYMPTVPTDKVAGRLMTEIHFYDPFNFALMNKDESWGKQAYYWGAGNHSTTDTDRNPTWGEEDYVDAQFASLKTALIDKGIPVLLGEFAAQRRTNLTGDALALHLKSRNYYHTYVVKKARANGVVPFFWDVGAPDDQSGSIFDRRTYQVRGQATLDALMAGLAP